MASVTMSATFFTRPSPVTPNRRLASITCAATKTNNVEKVAQESTEKEAKNGRRNVMFAAAAAAAALCSVAGVALADEPGRGSKEAKKAYAPVCVTMPTARICHK